MPEERPVFFISYSQKDAQFVLRLAKELRAAGADLWLDQLDILGGQLRGQDRQHPTAGLALP